MDLQQHRRILLTVHQRLDPPLQLLQHPAETQPPQPAGERRKLRPRLRHRELNLDRRRPYRRGHLTQPNPDRQRLQHTDREPEPHPLRTVPLRQPYRERGSGVVHPHQIRLHHQRAPHRREHLTQHAPMPVHRLDGRIIPAAHQPRPRLQQPGQLPDLLVLPLPPASGGAHPATSTRTAACARPPRTAATVFTPGGPAA